MRGSRMQRETRTLKPLIHLSGGADFSRQSVGSGRRMLAHGVQDVEHNPGMNFDKWRHYARGRLLELLRNPEEAMAEYRRALDADPAFRRAANALAYRGALTGNNAVAIECFERVVRLDGRDPHAQFNLGFVYAKAGEQRKAIGHFRSAVDLNRKLDRAWYGLGLAHAALGEHREAMEALQQAAELQPMASPVWYQYGMACHHAHEPDGVRRVAHHLNRFDPRTTRRLILDAERADLAHLVKDLEV
jgi:tetratricopeptide (TPR) repeat protein